MNDRFKFRCIINNKVKDVFYFYELPTNKEIVFACTNLEDNTGYYIPKCQLLQSTGLKDKNGKLIYEGDVIAFMNPYENDKLMAITVNWESTLCITGFNFGGEFAKNVEVISNIYENPELLKGLKNE